MTGFSAFLAKELTEIRRTWRLWVIPGMLLFFGVTSPIIAAVTPALVKSMASAQPGMVIQLPPPTALEAFAQFIKTIDQFVLIAVIIAGAGIVSGERSSGTAILALTKPLSRAAFVLAKIVVQVGLLLVSTVLGTVACALTTAAVFGGADNRRLAIAVTLWFVYATVLIVIMALFSSAFRSRGAAAGAGLAFFFLTLLLSTWGPASRYSFVGLWPAQVDALRGSAVSASWMIATAAGAILVGAFAAVRVFERQEL